MHTWHNKFSQWIFHLDHSDLNWYHSVLIDGVILLGVIGVAVLAYYMTRAILSGVVSKVVHKTKNTWDDELLTSKLFTWISLMTPTVIILKASPNAVITEAVLAHFIQTSATVMIVILAFLSVNSILNIIGRIYRRYPVSRELPIKSMIQVIQIILVLSSVIFIISILIGKSPILIFSGLGAMTAILMLIFKDSILGLSAGIQLSANRMVARGDWIEMPKFGADGEVLDVALTTVKVRNWDKTITTIPTYALISDSFKNWRGMSNSGVRRIKRSIKIDMSTIEFLDNPMLEKMKQINFLQDYITEKEREILEWNEQLPEDSRDNPINARALTNLGTFRAYVREYVKNHPKIDDQQTLLIRQLQPTEYGIPIELYIFTNDNRWIEYESIQSDIFDHLLSILPEFNLRAFQRPSDQAIRESEQSLIDS